MGMHPAQRDWVERDFSGPARVSGSAGTGKTIVALHRAVALARRFPDSRVLLATFSAALAGALHDKLRRLIASEPHLGERIDFLSMDELGLRVELRGRCRTLRVNYRTSHQIRRQADRLLGTEVSDADGNVDIRT